MKRMLLIGCATLALASGLVACGAHESKKEEKAEAAPAEPKIIVDENDQELDAQEQKNLYLPSFFPSQGIKKNKPWVCVAVGADFYDGRGYRAQAKTRIQAQNQAISKCVAARKKQLGPKSKATPKCLVSPILVFGVSGCGQ